LQAAMGEQPVMSITIEPAALDFGDLYEDLYAPGVPERRPEMAISLMNDGHIDVEIVPSQPLSPQFSWDEGRFVIPPSASKTLVLRFVPPDRDYGNHATTLTITTSDAAAPKFEIPVRGNFIFFP
jgi:hypothetical protein